MTVGEAAATLAWVPQEFQDYELVTQGGWPVIGTETIRVNGRFLVVVRESRELYL